MTDTSITSVTPERVGAILQAAGFRAEYMQDANGLQHIVSGTNGAPFNVRFVNRAPPPLEGYLDFSFIMFIKLDYEFPLERVNEWNKQRRFSRLHRNNEYVVLDMDLIVAGGVGENFLRASLELWDRIIRELMEWLRGDSTPSLAVNVA